MSGGTLLDTHTAMWLDHRQPLTSRSQAAIAISRAANQLYLSDISLWEFGTALHKRSFERRPNLQGLSLAHWVENFTQTFSVQRLPISPEVALEAAEVPAVYGYGDPGDCFLIATARIHQLALATHDTRILRLGQDKPDYLAVVAC